jgi:hypothetical protein
MSGDVLQIERALSLLGAALPERKQRAEPSIGCAVPRIGEQARRVLEHDADARHEFDADLLGGEMRAHDARDAVHVGDGDGFEA